MKSVEYGALTLAALAAVYGIWLGVGLPPLPFGIHGPGSARLDAPLAEQLPNSPLGGLRPRFLPVTFRPTPGLQGELDIGRSARATHATAKKQSLSPTPASYVARDRLTDASAHAAAPSTTEQLAQPSQQTPPAASPPPLPLPTTVTLPSATLPALPTAPPEPQLPPLPQAPSPPPVTPALPSVP
jgi:hypothetical protein